MGIERQLTGRIRLTYSASLHPRPLHRSLSPKSNIAIGILKIDTSIDNEAEGRNVLSDVPLSVSQTKPKSIDIATLTTYRILISGERETGLSFVGVLISRGLRPVVNGIGEDRDDRLRGGIYLRQTD